MDLELFNTAEWGGAAAPKEPPAPIGSAVSRESPARPSAPQRPSLDTLPRNGANNVQAQPLPARPNIYTKREEPKPTDQPKFQYSDAVKGSSKQNYALKASAPFNSRSAPRQKDYLKQRDVPVPRPNRREPKQRIHPRQRSASRSQNGSTDIGRSGKAKAGFAHVRPRNFAEEDRNEMREMIAKENAQFTEPLEPSIPLPFELWFFWPDGAIDIEKLKQDYDRTLLQEIRSKYHCRIVIDTSEKLIRCYAVKESDLTVLHQRFLGLYREFTSKWNDLNVINFFNIPTFKNYSDWINIPAKATKDHGIKDLTGGPSRLAKPELDTERPALERRDEITRQRSKSLRANSRLMRRAIEVCIKDLRLTKQHVRMRLKIGEMFLTRYRNSANMKPITTPRIDIDQRYYQYSLEEFEDMISEELAEMDLRNIPGSRLDYENIMRKVWNSNIFGEPEESYTIDFDFIQPESKQILRFAIEYKNSHTAGELEVSQRHWLEIQPNEKYLALNVLDFESYDLQFQITALRRCTNPVILSQLGDFEASVTFTPPDYGLLSEVVRRSKFKSSTRSPDVIREKSTATFSIKDSNLKFELARYDTFRAPSPLPSLKNHASKPTSEWSFALYDPEWDTKLGELAYLEAGQEVSWPRTLRTFFPGPHKGLGTSKVGFKNFVAEVGMVTTILSGNEKDDDR